MQVSWATSVDWFDPGHQSDRLAQGALERRKGEDDEWLWVFSLTDRLTDDKQWEGWSSLFSFRSTTSVKIARLGLTIVKTQQSLTSKNMQIDEKKFQVIIYSGDGLFQVPGGWNLQCPKRPVFLAGVSPYSQSAGSKWAFFCWILSFYCVSVEIVLGVNTAMKKFEREQELAALYFKPKDDRVVDVEKAF